MASVPGSVVQEKCNVWLKQPTDNGIHYIYPDTPPRMEYNHYPRCA